MTAVVTSREIIALLHDESYRNVRDQFHRIVALALQVMDVYGCTLTLLDLEAHQLVQITCAGFDADFAARMEHRSVPFGQLASGATIDETLVHITEPVERYDLQQYWQGIIHPHVAKKYDLQSALFLPLWSGERLFGHLNFFSQEQRFIADPNRRSLLLVFAHQVSAIIEGFEQQLTLNRTLSSLSTLTGRFLTAEPASLLSSVASEACALLKVPVCLVRQLDGKRKKLQVVATSGTFATALAQVDLDATEPRVREWFMDRQVTYLSDVTQAPVSEQYGVLARQCGARSLLCGTMWVGEQLVGTLEVYTSDVYHFKEWEKQLFQGFVNSAALAVWSFRNQQRLQQMNAMARELADIRELPKLLAFVLTSILELVDASRGGVGTLIPATGEIEFLDRIGEVESTIVLQPGQGLGGEALARLESILVEDLCASSERTHYHPRWPDSRSELTVPLILSNARVRTSKGSEFLPKVIGVFNVEREYAGAFTSNDLVLLESFASQVVIAIERLQHDLKQEKLRQVEQTLSTLLGREKILEALLQGVVEVFGFDFACISLVNAARTHIQARYVFGLSPEKCQAYKAMSNHRLNEDPSDIQAEIVRTGAIEVPEKDDPRLDQAIFDQFEHAKLVRVFLPLKLLPGYEQVIGTLEVAYDRGAGSPTSERDVRIYESDVQLLENLLRSTMRRIELRELGLLEKLPHEFRSPIVGIRNQAANLLFLRERSDNKALVDDRLNDILTDCQTLLNLVSTLEHGLGRPRHKPKLQPTAVFRDVVIKSVRQLRPFAEREGFDADRILYLPYDSHRITIYTDRASLSQVATNLITNAIKYAKDDPRDFSIAIKVAETRTNYLIHFEDRGIGVPAGSEDRIFEEGYRASNAIARNITGSGLGLTISREIMLELGGDLWLTSEPGSPVTVFTMVLPKYLANKPED